MTNFNSLTNLDQNLDFYKRTYPKPIDGIETHDLGEEMLLYAVELEIGVTLNNSSIAIWELCDGSLTILEIAQTLAEELEISLENIITDIITAITRFSQLGILELSSL